jgi:hypothetical protein
MFNAPNIDEIGTWYLDNCPGTHYDPPYNVPDGSLTIWTNTTTQPCMINYVPELQQQGLQALKRLQKSEIHPYSWRENIQRWINWLNQDLEQYSVDYKNLLAWRRGIDALDIARGTDLCTSVPRLQPLYELATQIEQQTDQTHCHTS